MKNIFIKTTILDLFYYDQNKTSVATNVISGNQVNYFLVLETGVKNINFN